ncbi:MAG: hypothetical protein OEZ24_05920 [Candidatus Bathyarchaeota archaeon]|nr:hypothetical protein [Candidatus Bathyarchaeota archaeon]
MSGKIGCGEDGLVEGMVHQTAKKTLILPVHPKTTAKKLRILRRMAARWTYGVQLYLDMLFENNASLRELYDVVADATGLNKPYT